ncbi:MAG: polysaccharide deacetylase family protein [Treponema sp.]|nr:polysaccharide deacetylase family protein [Candidatus Treponema scatequi]
MKKSVLIGLVSSVVLFMSCASSCKEPDKLVALSFDDGPNSEMTELVLDKLEKHHVTGTFFLIGRLVTDETAPTLKRMVDMGCEINNHSWEYESMDHMNEQQVRNSIKKTNDVIYKYTGQTPKFFRAPNLATSEELYQYVDMPFICGVLAMDWQGCNTDAKMRAQNVLNGVQDGAIILMHDVQPYPHPTPEALDIIIPKLKKQGYEFVTVSELFKRKGITPAIHEENMWTYVR